MSPSGVPIRFKSSTYTAIIVKLTSVFLINTHGQIELFTYPSLNKYVLKTIVPHSTRLFKFIQRSLQPY